MPWATFARCERGHLVERILMTRAEALDVGDRCDAIILAERLLMTKGETILDTALCGAQLVELLSGCDAFAEQMRRDYERGCGRGQGVKLHGTIRRPSMIGLGGAVEGLRVEAAPLPRDARDMDARERRYGYSRKRGVARLAGFIPEPTRPVSVHVRRG